MKKDIPAELRASIWVNGGAKVINEGHWLNSLNVERSTCHSGYRERELGPRHRERHDRRILAQFRIKIGEHFQWYTNEIKVLEYLLNEKSQQLWNVSRHKDLDYAVKDISRWWTKYLDLVFDDLQDIYNFSWNLTPHQEGDRYRTVELEELEHYINGVCKFNELLHIIRRVNEAGMMNKHRKERYLRDIRASILRHWKSNIFGFEYRTELVYRGPEKSSADVAFPYPRLRLDFMKVIERTLDRLEHPIRMEVDRSYQIPDAMEVLFV